MMRMIPPILIDDSVLTSTTAVYLTDEWDVVETYSIGDLVHSTTTERVYYALQASTGKDPATNPVDGSNNLYWQDSAPSNPMAMFDELNNTQTMATTSLVTVITPGERVDSVAIFNVSGVTNINVTVTSVSAGGETFNTDYIMTESEGPPMWDRIFGTLIEKTNVVADGFLAYSDNVITITFTGSDIGVGNVVIGQQFIIGEVGDGLTINPRDYSLIETSAEGEPTYIPRASSFEISGTAKMDSANVDPFMQRITNRKTPRAFIVSDEYQSANVFGVNTNFPVKISIAPDFQILTFKIIGYI